MDLLIYNSQTRKKEIFQPWQSPQVKMYCCGPTVYGLLHVGNFRGAIFYNLVRRWLTRQGYQVTMVYNYTDVDDKIIAAANKEGIEAQALADRYIEEFKKDFNRLKLDAHDANPKVSEYLHPILEMVSELIEKNRAYVSDGEVLYSIESFSEYGKLSNRKTEELLANVRIEKDDRKKGPLDFSLWKPAKAGEPSWESPWGLGRPGWHIECSAMARKILGDQIDIHGGGIDLLFPHHENEIAQTEGCTGKTYVKYWIHNNLIEFGGAKMSKSLGNIMTARTFMDQYHPELLKYIILSVHYRSLLDFSEKYIHQSISSLARIYSAMAKAEDMLVLNSAKEDLSFQQLLKDSWKKIEAALNDDFNTPQMWAVLFDVVRNFNAQAKPNLAQAFLTFIKEVGQLMSLFLEPSHQFLRTMDDWLLAKMNLQRAHIDTLVAERSQARSAKDFARSDQIRNELTKMGIAVSDTAKGSVWEVAK